MDKKTTLINTVSPLDCGSYLCQPDWTMIPRDLVKHYFFFYHVSKTGSLRDKRLKTQNEWKSYCHQDRRTSSIPLRKQSEQKVTTWKNVFYVNWDICPPNHQVLRFLILECCHSDWPHIIGFLDPQTAGLALDLLYSFSESLIYTGHRGTLPPWSCELASYSNSFLILLCFHMSYWFCSSRTHCLNTLRIHFRTHWVVWWKKRKTAFPSY